MESEIRKLLEQNLELEKENNSMLRKLRNGQKWSRVGRLFYWLFLIAITLGGYYYIAPYTRILSKVYEENKNLFNGNFSDFNMIKTYLNGNIENPLKQK